MSRTNFHILRSGYADYSNPCHGDDGKFCSGGSSQSGAIDSLDKIKGTNIAGRPKADIAAESFFKNKMPVPIIMSKIADISDSDPGFGRLPIKEVAISKLSPTQSTMNRNRIKENIGRLANEAAPPAKIISLGGKLYIKDGHHRIAAQKLLEIEKINAHVMEI